MPTFEVVKPGEKTGQVFAKKEDAGQAATKTCRIMVWEKGRKIATMVWSGGMWKDRSGNKNFVW